MKKVIKILMAIGILSWIYFVLFLTFKGVITGVSSDLIFEDIALLSFGAGLFELICGMVIYLINVCQR